jgi:hypothetical protein
MSNDIAWKLNWIWIEIPSNIFLIKFSQNLNLKILYNLYTFINYIYFKRKIPKVGYKKIKYFLVKFG